MMTDIHTPEAALAVGAAAQSSEPALSSVRLPSGVELKAPVTLSRRALDRLLADILATS